MPNVSTFAHTLMPSSYPIGTGDYQQGEIEVAGDVYYVNSSSGSDSASAGRSKSSPFRSLSYAAARTAMNPGDVIKLMPGSTYTCSSATGLVLSEAGVSIEGMGWGSLRPTITLDTIASATISVTAANVRLKNVIITANFADIVSAFTVTATGFRLEDCLIRATATNMNFLHVLDTNTTDNSADGLSMVRCQWYEPDAATLAMMLLDSAVNRMEITDNVFITGNATANIPLLISGATGKNMNNLRILRNHCYMTGNSASTAGLFIVTDGTTGTGVIADNTLYSADATTELFITATHKFSLHRNTYTAVFAAQGYPLPAIDS